MNDDLSRVHELESEATVPPHDQERPEILSLLTPPKPLKGEDPKKVARFGRLLHAYTLSFVIAFVLLVGLFVFAWPRGDTAGGFALFIVALMAALGFAVVAIPVFIMLPVYLIKSHHIAPQTRSRTLTLPMAISLVFFAFVLFVIGWFLYGVYGPGN